MHQIKMCRSKGIAIIKPGGNNHVFYLTLKGDDPIPESKGVLEAGTDFFNISYRETIVKLA